jgi:hypothetical protein
VNGTTRQTNKYGADVLRQAVNVGYQQGAQAGQADRADGIASSYQRSFAYQDANYGYTGNYVAQSEYTYYFRQGFRRGYTDGYGTRAQYGTGRTRARQFSGVFSTASWGCAPFREAYLQMKRAPIAISGPVPFVRGAMMSTRRLLSPELSPDGARGKRPMPLHGRGWRRSQVQGHRLRDAEPLCDVRITLRGKLEMCTRPAPPTIHALRGRIRRPPHTRKRAAAAAIGAVRGRIAR